MLMPQKLVVVFTPNRQSYTGIKELVRRATKYRRKSNDLRPLLVFPLPSRIEPSRDDLRAYWRFNQHPGILGYQPMFEELFNEVYGLSECNLSEYFEEVQIQHSANYAYGEEIAVLGEKTKDSFSLSRNYEAFSEWLVNSVAPWQRIYSKGLKPPSTIRIAFLSANPKGMSLKSNEEYVQINDKIRATNFREQYDLLQERAISLKDIQEVFVKHQPDIVHFSGRGSKESGLVYQNESQQSEIVSSKSLIDLFKTSGKSVRCVFLSSCYSQKQANAIAREVATVVGTFDTISDDAAADFSASFYLALGYGNSIKDAFDLGYNQLKLLKISDEQMPILTLRKDVDPSSLVLIRGKAMKIPLQESQQIDVQKQLSYINSIKIQLSESYRNDLAGKVSVDEFLRVFSSHLSKLTTDREIEYAIGIENVQLLQSLRISLATSMSEYEKSKYLGIEDERERYLNRIMDVAIQVINALNDIQSKQTTISEMD